MARIQLAIVAFRNLPKRATPGNLIYCRDSPRGAELFLASRDGILCPVTEYFSISVPEGPAGRDGKDGVDGKDGAPGRDGKDGISIKGDKGDPGDVSVVGIPNCWPQLKCCAGRRPPCKRGLSKLSQAWATIQRIG